MRGLIKKAVGKYIDFKSVKTDRHLLVIESDDWGSYRTMNNQIRAKLNAISKRVQEDKFVQLDNIANETDLSEFFETLQSVKDAEGNPACVTANICTANPDFDKIKASGFEEFYYKPFTSALREYSQKTDIFGLWKKGMHQKIFVPQLHGREHLHALAWLAELRVGNKDLLKAFDLQAWGIPYHAILRQKRSNLQAALDVYHMQGEEAYHRKWIIDSAQIFKDHFGCDATSFIAPAYTWHSNAHKHLNQINIKSLQGIKLQYEPNSHQKKTIYNKRPHHIGEVDKNSGLVHLPRNAFFEPASAPQKDWVRITLDGIKDAFHKNQPAIIGSHRINYIGSLNEKNRTHNLAMLKTILQKTIQQYPEVEFVSSKQLADIIL